MRVLILSPYPERIASTLHRARDVVFATNEPVDTGFMSALRIEYVVSYGFQHILPRDIIKRLDGRIVNLHISALPWNRGIAPNFWSFFDDTPKGVTIHLIDASVDTGDILAQRRIKFGGRETLATSYERLRTEIEALFDAVWRDIRAGTISPVKQIGGGSYHCRRDKEIFMRLLPDGWNTPVATVERLGRDWRRTAAKLATVTRASETAERR
jgi:methionyl-tRNA formyltransferase